MIKNILFVMAAIILVILLINIYPGMIVKVIDAESGKPVEGAVIMAEWTETKGAPGLTYTESYKVIESKTNDKGWTWISGSYNPFADLGSLVVYKKGYVAWSKDYIFPDHEKRTDFMWCCFYKALKLEKFKPEYSYIDHTSFIDSNIFSGLSQKKMIEESYRWEQLRASEERENFWKEKRGQKHE